MGGGLVRVSPWVTVVCACPPMKFACGRVCCTCAHWGVKENTEGMVLLVCALHPSACARASGASLMDASYPSGIRFSPAAIKELMDTSEAALRLAGDRLGLEYSIIRKEKSIGAHAPINGARRTPPPPLPHTHSNTTMFAPRGWGRGDAVGAPWTSLPSLHPPPAPALRLVTAPPPPWCRLQASSAPPPAGSSTWTWKTSA